MADTFNLQGMIQTCPVTGTPPGFFAPVAQIAETSTLQVKLLQEIPLNADGPVSVDLASFANGVNIVYLKAIGGAITARLTSTKGTTQAIPVDPLQIIISNTVAFTALDIARPPGIPVRVEVFVGAKS